MGLNLDPQLQAALDLAKRALPEGARLDVDLLLDSLFHATPLGQRLSGYAPYFKAPAVLRPAPPAKVPLADAVKPVMERLAGSGNSISPAELFRALAESPAGRELLRARGMAESEQTAMCSALEEKSGWRSTPRRAEVVKALSTYGRMLTEGDPPHPGFVGMEGALKSLVRTMSKMRRKNAIVVGFPGTGKSAVVYEFARRLRQGHPSIPAHLRDYDIFELSPSFLRSGASMVGQYDERVKSLIKILRAHPKVILFVDEIHSLFQSGLHERTPFSEANEAFKGVLGRGEIICIGCTTTAEYRHFIEPDAALARRFSIIRLEPPTREEALGILKARRPKMEQYFAPLRIPDAMLERAVELTEDHLPSRFQPDKSIQLLDEACAHCVSAEPRIDVVSEEALWKALEDIVGHSLVRTGQLTEARVYDELRKKIVGQDETLESIARAFLAGLGGWTRKAAPRGVFLFCGPTGVGKTETALLLAKLLGGGRDALLRIDCNTLQGSGHDSGPALNRLLGVPPGYIGYSRGQGGILSRVRDLPESIVLFDEIEKADPGVSRLLLQILDDGRVEDTDGNLLDFRRSFIVFTTNAGTVLERTHIGFGAEEPKARAKDVPHVDLEALKAQLRSLGYGEEFLGRIQHFFVFRALEPAAIEAVIQRQLAGLRGAAELRGFELDWSPEVVAHLTAQWQPRFGVRHLTTILRNRITEQLSVAEAQNELAGVRRIRLQVLPAQETIAAQGLAGLASRERQAETMVIKLA
jgi:ATP-dependent Clp protease ATP-binding subunit ClpA